MNNLRERLVESLDQKAVKACSDYKRSEAELISALQAIDKERASAGRKKKTEGAETEVAINVKAEDKFRVEIESETESKTETGTETGTGTATETDIRIPFSEPPAKKVVARRQPLKAKLLHELNLRDKGTCTHTENQKRCGSTRWIHIHHIIPLSEGGSDRIENLVTLCSAHHRFLHRPQH